MNNFGRYTYYIFRPIIPLSVRWFLQRCRAGRINGLLTNPTWPIFDYIKSEKIVWPKNNKIPFILTHDVDSQFGFDNIRTVCEVEKHFNLKSCWFIVPNLYKIDMKVIDYLNQSGMEIGVHDWNHDGKLFLNRKFFNRRIDKINRTIKMWRVKGFRSGSAFHNDKWMPELECEYDSSYYDTDPYQPMRGGCSKIIPFRLNNLVELPYTMPQDHVIFIQNAKIVLNAKVEKSHKVDINVENFIRSWCKNKFRDNQQLNEKMESKSLYSVRGVDIWKMKTQWLFEQNGMVLMITHPDYLCNPKLNINNLKNNVADCWLKENDMDIQEVRDKGIIKETWYGSLLEQYAAFLNWFKREFDGSYYNYLSWELADWFRQNKNIVIGNKNEKV